MSRPVPTFSMLLLGCDEVDTSATNRNDAERPVSSPTPIPAPRPLTSVAAKGILPAEVVAFRDRSDQCDHFQGEEASDDARAVELEKALERTCRGTDAELAGLRRRYRNDVAVITALRAYEDQVE